jgi:hypothetical protein
VSPLNEGNKDGGMKIKYWVCVKASLTNVWFSG